MRKATERKPAAGLVDGRSDASDAISALERLLRPHFGCSARLRVAQIPALVQRPQRHFSL
jgi:hypothetical protein